MSYESPPGTWEAGCILFLVGIDEPSGSAIRFKRGDLTLRLQESET